MFYFKFRIGNDWMISDRGYYYLAEASIAADDAYNNDERIEETEVFCKF